MTAIIQAQYDTIEEIAKQFGARGESIAQMHGVLAQRVDALRDAGWEGDGAQSFFREMDGVVLPAVTRLSDALHEADAVTLRIAEVYRSAEEEAANLFQPPDGQTIPSGDTPSISAPSGGGGTGTGAGGNSGGGGGIIGKLANIAGQIVDLADTLDDTLPIPAAILLSLGLKAGKSYPGQVLVRAPEFIKRLGLKSRWLKNLAGVAENLSHIKGANLAKHIGRGAKKLPVIGWVISGGLGVKAVAEVWSENWDEYGGYDPARRVTAMGVDAGIAIIPVAGEVAGGIGGAIGGAKAGALIGAVGGPVGVAAGALIGGAIGGFAGDWLGGKIGDGVAGKINEIGGRDAAINWIDNNIGQPISNGIGDAIDAVRDFELPSISLPSIRLGF